MEEELKKIGMDISLECGMFDWNNPQALMISVMVYKKIITIEEACEIVKIVNKIPYRF